MESFISLHTAIGFVLLLFGIMAAVFPKEKRSFWQSVIVRTFFSTLLFVGISGIVIGIYRHPTYPSVFQMVTFVGLIFAIIGTLAERGILKGFRGKSNLFWYINGLGGSLIATVSASLFFLALTYFKDFYQANIIWFTIAFIAIPVLIGREFIKRNLKKPLTSQ